MRRGTVRPRMRPYLIPALILVVGWGGAGWIYLTAGNASSDGGVGYEIIDGQSYPVDPHDSKRYQQQLQLYGGKMAVLADSLTRWLAGLWHGKTLAYTAACLTVLLSMGWFFAARLLPAGLEPDDRDEKTQPGTP